MVFRSREWGKAQEPRPDPAGNVDYMRMGPVCGPREGGVHGLKPDKLKGFGGIHGLKPYRLIGFGGVHGLKPYIFIGFGGKTEATSRASETRSEAIMGIRGPKSPGPG